MAEPKVLSTGAIKRRGITYEARVVEGSDGFPHVQARMSLLNWLTPTQEEADTYVPDPPYGAEVMRLLEIASSLSDLAFSLNDGLVGDYADEIEKIAKTIGENEETP